MENIDELRYRLEEVNSQIEMLTIMKKSLEEELLPLQENVVIKKYYSKPCVQKALEKYRTVNREKINEESKIRMKALRDKRKAEKEALGIVVKRGRPRKNTL